ncbi:hypothetical protein SKAU_G00328400 [Synaphobranchus kaupii]|uniref:Protein kinase domain-containing protein n=1 Tax=Synaphobranchus kaupii TaxID=118154 RepID=A0A9Q1EQ67_SYNKA|nr:hypothetical protein SKAU_G00328400 [Synaphobranchus kaupii]
MAAMPLLPCPVRLGVVKDGGPAEQLHKYTLEKNLHKMEKLLKKGVHVDSANNVGQTPLFCASLLGLTTAVELLLRYGADPNHRCEDRSTPVHAAVFSCKPWLLSGVLDAGGDLRLHDHKGHTPQDWAKAGAQQHSQRMVDFLKRCVSHMHSLSQPLQPLDHHRTPSSSKTLLRSSSLLEFLRTGGSDLHVNKKMSTKSSLFDTVQCFGFGKLCVDRPRQPLGLLASLPFIADRELGQADDEPMISYTCGSFVKMTNWKGCRVTVKELQSQSALQLGNQVGYLDLIITEQEYCSQLYHPHLLQLLAVSMCADLQQIRLVFERVHVGSLHTLLHHKREQFPVLQAEGLLSLVLHVCEALLYLHGRGLVMRSLSSHAVQIVHPAVAKVTGLGFTVPSCEREGPGNPSHLPLPQGLYNWAAPEVIRNRACTEKADVYSLCAVIQELNTDAVPWGPVDPRWIRQAVESGQALTADQSIPQPYYQLVKAGLQPRAQDRSSSLQDLRYLLRCDIKEWRGSGLSPETTGPRAAGWSPESMQNRDESQSADRAEEGGACDGRSDSAVEREIEAQLNQLDRLLNGQEEEAEVLTISDQTSLQSTSLDPRLDSSQESGSESSAPSGTGWQGVPAAEPASRETEHIGSVVLNLKVSQVLLRQSESSLRVVEAALGAGRDGGRGVDEVDGTGANQPDGGWREGGRDAHVIARATGPPSRSYPPCRGACPQPGTPQGATSDRPLGTEGRSTRQRGLEDSRGEQDEHLSIGEEEPSFYSSAQEDSFVNTRPRHAQAERSSVSTGGTERRIQQSTCRQGLENRTYTLPTTAYPPLCSRTVYSPCGSPQFGWCDQSTTAKWTSEVSDAVARMARGRFGATPCPVSSDSEETDKMMWAGRRDPLGHSDPRRSVGDLHEVESGHSSAEMEHLFKSFAGIQSESEADSDFHTVDRTFSMTCGAWDEAGQSEEEDTSDSDYSQAPEGPSSMFYTPNPELQSHPTGRCSQTPSSDGDLEVTMEVCQPTTGQHAPFSVASGVPDLAELAELSSITRSPAQHQEWAGQASLRPSLLSRRPAPCNSTPRSPVGSPQLRPGDSCAEPLPLLPCLLDTFPGSNTPSQPLSSETFATASPGDSSTTEPSASSILQARRETTSALGSQHATHPRDGAPAGSGQTAEADSSEWEARAPGGGAGVVTANRGEGLPAKEGADSKHSNLGCSDSEHGDAHAPAVPQYAAGPRSERPTEGGVEISAEGAMPEAKGKPDVAETPDREILGEGGPEQEKGFGSGSGPDSAVLGSGVSGEKDQKRMPSADDRSIMEETQRAHSTLDEDLQGLQLEMATGQRFMGNPGAVELPRAQEGVRSEKTSHPGGNSMEAVVAEGKEASSFQRK